MRKKLVLLLSMCLFMTLTSVGYAATTLKRLGDNPFYRPPLTSEADLQTMVKNHSDALKTGFAEAGYKELFPEFIAQLPTAKIDLIMVAPGQQVGWMLFRNKGTGPVRVIKDVTWGGKAAFQAYRFFIDKNERHYEFIVPTVCGNLSLGSITAVAKEVITKQVNQPPVCRMQVSNATAKCGQLMIVDASRSTDVDGSIAEVVFKIVDSKDKTVAEKRAVERPFKQEFPVPCDSPQYTVKVMVVDNNGAVSNASDCSQVVTVEAEAKRRGGPVVDIGYAHQFDPANYFFGRVGYELPFLDNFSVMGLIGGFGHVQGDDGESAFIADVFLNYYFTDKLFVGVGSGFWSGDDGKVELIANVGYLINEQPGIVRTSLFLEGFQLINTAATCIGAGIRFQF